MKTPAVAVAAAFADGILLGLPPHVIQRIHSPVYLIPSILGIAAAVEAGIGIVSAGQQNPYGHPSPVLLERLEENGLWVLRTDKQGAVQVVTDGDNLRVNWYVACLEPQRLGSMHTPDDHQKNE